jgi:hypothetical protein
MPATCSGSPRSIPDRLGDATIVQVVETPNGFAPGGRQRRLRLPDRSINQGNVLIMANGLQRHPAFVACRRRPVLGPGNRRRHPAGRVVRDQWVDDRHAGVNDYRSSFDSDDLRWSSTYADRVDAGYASATGIATVPGGDYVVSGTTGMTETTAG